jgi:hypothetical protein
MPKHQQRYCEEFKMKNKATIHFRGIETVAASTDGNTLIFKTFDADGNPYDLALNSDEASIAIMKILRASVPCEKNHGAPTNATKAISIYDIRLMVKDSPTDDAALAVTFEPGTAPIGMSLSKFGLTRFAEDVLQVLNPLALPKPYTTHGKIPN